MTAKNSEAVQESRPSQHLNVRIIADIVLLIFFFLCIPSLVHMPDAPKIIPVKPLPTVSPHVTASYEKKISKFFLMPDKLKPQVDFWKKIFTKYTRNEVVIHDDWYVNIVYKVVNLKKNGKRSWKPVRDAKKKYKKILSKLAENWHTPERMTKEEHRIYLLFKEIDESPFFRKQDAVKRLHAQQGQADSFKKGIIQSGKYAGIIKTILAKYKVPEELVWLPLIESAFNPYARSHVGAAGMWQLMKATAKQYGLKIDYLFDARQDPVISTHAAARHLAYNYKVLKSWPLAITAYNHGLGGMIKAFNKLGSKDIAKIVEQYNGKRFEFASRNFYAEFLAALEVGKNYKKYYGDIILQSQLDIVQIEIPDYIAVKTLEKYLGIDTAKIKALNPGLMPAVFESGNFMPKNIKLNMPKEFKADFKTVYASIPLYLKLQQHPAPTLYRVKKGQTLSDIAKIHKISTKSLARANNIRNPKRIRSGQRLKIPRPYLVNLTKSYSQNSLKISSVRHRVRRGQTLSDIAKLYGISAKSIAKVNKIKNLRKIRAGQLLKIPEG